MIERPAWIAEVARSTLGYLGLLHGPDGVMACVIGHATHADAARALEAHQRCLPVTPLPDGRLNSGPPSAKLSDQQAQRACLAGLKDHAGLKGLADLRADVSKSRLMERLLRRAEGACDDFLDIPLPLDDRTPFQFRVLTCCRAIPWGETRTYGQLARAAGSPGAARAVGQVMATNRLPLIVPCHRVVPASGGLGGFSAPQGTRLKRSLLEQEQLEPES